MLKFFRRIRSNLINQGSLKKYLIYAIGEIFLVMIGILLALQVNNWNQNESKKQIELEYLLSLKSEFEINLREFEKVNEYRKTMARDLVTLMRLSGTAQPVISEEELSYLLNNSVYNYAAFVFSAKTPVLQEIISSGNLINITNPELRQYLVTWEQEMDDVIGTQEEYKNFRDELLSLIIKNGSMKELGKADIYTENIVGLNFPNKNIEILQNGEAGNLFFLMYGEIAYYEKSVYPSINNYLDNILNLIQEEIN